MLESVEKLVLAGLGALIMSRERAEKLYGELVERGQAEKDRREGFVADLMEASAKTRKELEDLVAKQVHHAVEKLNLATKQDIERLEAKLDGLNCEES